MCLVDTHTGVWQAGGQGHALTGPRLCPRKNSPLLTKVHNHKLLNVNSATLWYGNKGDKQGVRTGYGGVTCGQPGGLIMASCWCFSRGCQAENSGSFRRYFFTRSPLPSTALIIFHQTLHRLTCMVMSLPWNWTTFILDQTHLSIYLFLKRSICASETGARHQLLPFAPLTANASGLNKEGNLASSGTLQWRHFLKVIALMLVNRSQPLPSKPWFGTFSSFEGSEKKVFIQNDWQLLMQSLVEESRLLVLLSTVHFARVTA